MITVPTVVANSHSHQQRFVNNSAHLLPTQVITQQQIKASGAHDLQTVLEEAGLQVHSLGSGNNLEINFRGFGDNAEQNTLILLNGLPLTRPGLGNLNLKQINLSSIKKIEIIPGSAGVLYGNQAVAGVINIVTNAQQNNSLSASYGSHNSYNIQGSFSKKLSKTLKLGANFEQNNSDNYRDRNKIRQSTLNLSLDKKFKHSSLQANYFFTHQHMQYPGALSIPQAKQNPRQAENAHDFFQYNKQLLELAYKQQLNSNWQLKLAGLGELMNGEGRLYDSFNEKLDEINFSPSIKGLWQIDKFSVIPTLGLAFNKGRFVFNSATYDSRATQTTYASFAQFNLPLSNSWTLIAGARYAIAHSDQFIDTGSAESNSSNDHAFITTEGLAWQINSGLKWFIRRAGSYRFPKTGENINTNTNKPLKTQTGVSYETGFNWKTKKWNGLVSVYQIDLKNEINAIPIPNSHTTYVENVNLAPTRRSGFSINNQYQLCKALQLDAVYRYVDAKFRSGANKGNLIPFVSANVASLGLNYNINSHWSLYLNSVYNGKKSFADDTEQRSRMLGGYTLYNANIRYQQKAYSLSLRLNNLSNKRFYAYAFDVYNGNNTSSYVYPADGFSALLTFSVKLGA